MSHASSKGAYRFFNNKKVTIDVILTPHVESTITRIRNYPVVLAQQDTTTLRYMHPGTEGLGPINTSTDNAMGMILHDTVAFIEEGTPLGVLDAQCWVRDNDDRHKKDRRKSLPIQEKESMKWLRSFQRLAEIRKHCPQTQLISIGDWESDIYELFMEAQKHQSGPKLLVRVNRWRERRVESQDNEQAKTEEQPLLWDYVKEQTIAGELQIHVPRKVQKPGREAKVEVRFSEITLQPPKNSEFQPLNNVWAVYVLEAGAEDMDLAIEWMLLTTTEVHTFEEAAKVISWYNGRWGLEVYHRTLKCGCLIEDRQLSRAESLQACLGIDMVIAWRIYHLTMLGREIPEHPCTVFFEEIEWKSLWCLSNNSRTAPVEPPTLNEAIRMLGQLGGHLGRKSDGMPGTECIWRGLQRLDSGIRMYSIFTEMPLPQIWNSYPDTYNCSFGGP
ncbi:MAG: IS4 family transposase [Ignavibacteriales bacterium]|nr:IS4 family transposase [Ignavibacteriales bacterium]